MSREGGGYCDECGVERVQQEKTTRELQEKLEQAQLQNSLLEKECERLREELREAKWNGFSTVRTRPPPPTLPTELLCAIFDDATSMHGLAFVHWHQRTKRDSWSSTSLTRRSIPLVCRRWCNLGTQFLYKHIVLFTSRQASTLMTTLRIEHHSLGQDRLGSIQGVEVLFEASPSIDYEESFLSDALNIIQMLPTEQLTLFSMETTHISAIYGPTSDIVSTVLNQHRNSLENLNLPIRAQRKYDIRNLLSPDIGGNPTFSSVRTLSLAAECWWNSAGPDSTNLISNINFPTLRELSVQRSWNSVDILSSVRRFQNLRKLHIIDYTVESTLSIAGVLELLPTLECLSIFYQMGHDWCSPKPLDQNHLHLKEIVVWSKRRLGYQCIESIDPVSSFIERKQLPSLQSITIHGPFLFGCVDNSFVMAGRHKWAWMQLISTCKENKIRLVNSSGDSIHIWTMRHEIIWKKEIVRGAGSDLNLENNTRSSISSETSSSDEAYDSDEDEWAEVETHAPDNASEFSDAISDDSGDAPYRYVHQNDVDLVNSDSSELELPSVRNGNSDFNSIYY